jgi:hypothetical protein
MARDMKDVLAILLMFGIFGTIAYAIAGAAPQHHDRP